MPCQQLIVHTLTRSPSSLPLVPTSNRKYRPCEKQKLDPTVARAKRLAFRPTSRRRATCLTRQYLAWTTRRPGAACWWCQHKIQTREHLFKNCPQWKSRQKTLWTTVLEETRKLPGPARGRDRTQIAELLADERCSQAVLGFLATTDVGRTSGPTVAADEDGAASEASEWDAREQADRRRSAWRRRNGLGWRLGGISLFFTIFKFLCFFCSQLPVRLAGHGG